MKFELIDQDNWPRKECFEHFTKYAGCSYSVTVDVDITSFYKFIRKNNYRIYPSFTWAVSKCLNSQKEFRMGYDDKGNPGYYDYISPCYSVLNDQTKVMSDLCTDYKESFKEFYHNMTLSLDSYKKDTSYTTEFCPNFFIISCLPWFTYSAFNVNNETSQPFLFPMVTWGKFYQKEDKEYMPVTIQIHHAAADGYHCSLFYSELQKIMNNPEQYLK